MSRRSEKVLSEEDRILWHQVARTAKVLRPAKPAKPVAPAPVAPPKPAAVVPPPASAPPARTSIMPSWSPAVSQPPAPRGQIDRQTVDKLAKGRLQLEARLVLHGMRQDEAHSLLLSFVSRAHERGARYVLVITGKGPGGDGVLKRSVPSWLKTAPFQAYVSGLDHAARGHGGAGALYLRIKRRRT